MATVELNNVSKTYDNKVTVIRDVSFSIPENEFVVLVGPSGCGKSTLLRMIAGLEEISSGEIKIDDRTVNDVPPKDRDIAMVFQNYALYPHMTVFENIAFGLKLRHMKKDEMEARVNEAAKILDISDYLHRKPKALSGGQRQRVAIGRAIVRKPKVFLFDEPLSNLDAKLRTQMRIEIKKLHARLNTTIIYVTHDQVEAMTMGSQIVVLKDGLVQQIDAPSELYNNPHNKFVAGFIGSPSMNFIPGEIQKNDKWIFKSGEFSLKMQDEIINKWHLSSGASVKLGVRPEHIIDSRSVKQEKASDTFVIMSDLVEPIGNEVLVYSTLAGENICMRANPSLDYKPGQEISVTLKMDKLHFFDTQSGESLLHKGAT